MKSFIKILGTTVGVVLVALFVLGWAPDVTDFSSTQFGNDGATVYISTSASVTNLQDFNGLTVTNPATGSFINITNGNITASGLTTSTNGFAGSQAMTVATLPGSPILGQYVTWVTDAITPSRIGSAAYYDGAGWRIVGPDIGATASIPQFLLNCATRPRYYLGTNFACNFGNGFTPNLFSSIISGSGAAASSQVTGQPVPVLRSATGTTTTGTGGIYIGIEPLASGDYGYAVTRIAIPQLSTTSDTFYVMAAASLSTVTPYPAGGNFFLYDTNNATGDAGSNPSHWLCVTRNGSTSTVADSGTVVAINTYYVLGVESTTTNAIFYVNGTPVVTNTAHISPGVEQGANQIVKSAGGTSVFTYTDYMIYSYWLATPRTMF